MKIKKCKLIFAMTAALIISGNGIASAQNTGSSVVPGDFKFSFQERLRIETWDNTTTLSRAAKGGTSYARIKTSVMGQWYPSETVEIAAKLTNEFRNYFSPSTNLFHMNEIFIDQLYIKWNTKDFLDGALTAGRQNINFGEGFIVMDGTPLDGSRSTYFNALRYDLNLSKGQSLSFFALYNPPLDDFPVINGNDCEASSQGDGTWKIVDQKETGWGLYYTGQFEWANLQSYFIRKNYIKPDTKLGQGEADINTLGARLSAPLSSLFNFTFEGAYQFGGYLDNNQSSYGGYAYLDYKPAWNKSFLPTTFTIGAILLSGDDPNTKNNEGWDPIFSRWPKWSESYIYTLIKEPAGKVAYWSNITSVYASMKFTFTEQVGLNLDYHHMTAPEKTIKTAFVSGDGDTRGDLFEARLLFEVNKNLTGHFVFEHFIPGDYYFSGAEPANWARMEIFIKL